jgi:hypothetical protein
MVATVNKEDISKEVINKDINRAIHPKAAAILHNRIMVNNKEQTGLIKVPEEFRGKERDRGEKHVRIILKC